MCPWFLPSYSQKEHEFLHPTPSDDRDSIAVPIWAGDEVIAAINLTWMHKVATVPQIVKAHLPGLTAAAREISMRLVAA